MVKIEASTIMKFVSGANKGWWDMENNMNHIRTAILPHIDKDIMDNSKMVIHEEGGLYLIWFSESREMFMETPIGAIAVLINEIDRVLNEEDLLNTILTRVYTCRMLKH